MASSCSPLLSVLRLISNLFWNIETNVPAIKLCTPAFRRDVATGVGEEEV